MPLKHIILSWDKSRERVLNASDSIGPLLSKRTYDSKLYAYNSADWEIELIAKIEGSKDLKQRGPEKITLKAHEMAEIPFSYHASEETEDDKVFLNMTVHERYLR